MKTIMLFGKISAPINCLILFCFYLFFTVSGNLQADVLQGQQLADAVLNEAGPIDTWTYPASQLVYKQMGDGSFLFGTLKDYDGLPGNYGIMPTYLDGSIVQHNYAVNSLINYTTGAEILWDGYVGLKCSVNDSAQRIEVGWAVTINDDIVLEGVKGLLLDDLSRTWNGQTVTYKLTNDAIWGDDFEYATAPLEGPYSTNYMTHFLSYSGDEVRGLERNLHCYCPVFQKLL